MKNQISDEPIRVLEVLNERGRLMRGIRDVEFSENGVVVKTLHGEELAQSYRLRHRVFAESLKWVSETTDGQEVDLYDLWATTIGLVRDDGAVVGVARLIPSSGQFMIEKEFSALLPANYRVRKNSDTAEITRLAVDPDIRDKGRSTKMMLVLLKGVYQWAVVNEIRYYYLEVEHRFFRALRALGFPCEMLGEPLVVPPAGANSVAALYDMVRFDEENAVKKPQLLSWISTITTLQGETIVGRTSTYSNCQKLGLVCAGV